MNRRRALVLSGGGGRGAYHVGALRFLEENEWFPDVVVGTSIGAVNGAALASGHNAHSLWALWRRLQTKDVQKININPFKGNFLLDTMPLRETLETGGWIDFDRLNSEEAAVNLRITAMEVETGKLRIFGNSADLYPSRMERPRIELDHIIASCSIPIVYPATTLEDRPFWDGGTVANTPLSPAIDAGAEEIVVVLMTPWDDVTEEDDDPTKRLTPGNLLHAAGAAFEWALLASFQADLKMFNRVNELVNLRLENARLRAMNRVLQAQIEGREINLPDEDGDGIPDILQGQQRTLPEPVIVAPQRPLPVEQIIQYKHDLHERVYKLGYEDAKRAWQAAGRTAEGWG